MPQRSVLGPIPSNIFTKDWEECQCTLIKFADDIKLVGGPVTTLEDRAAIEEDLDRLDTWINRSHGRSSMGSPVPGKKESLAALQGRV